jgi:hypothetical protein
MIFNLVVITLKMAGVYQYLQKQLFLPFSGQ